VFSTFRFYKLDNPLSAIAARKLKNLHFFLIPLNFSSFMAPGPFAIPLLLDVFQYYFQLLDLFKHQFQRRPGKERIASIAGLQFFRNNIVDRGRCWSVLYYGLILNNLHPISRR
jgi:hypothetical protein